MENTEKQFKLKEKLEKILNNKNLYHEKGQLYEFKIESVIKQLLKDFNQFKKDNYIKKNRSFYNL